MVCPCVSEAAEVSYHGVGLYQSLRWEEAPGVNTFKALEGHIAKLLSRWVGQLVPPARLCPVRPGPSHTVNLTFAKVRDETSVLF